MGVTRTRYRILVEKPFGKRPLSRSTRWEDGKWMEVALDRLWY